MTLLISLTNSFYEIFTHFLLGTILSPHINILNESSMIVFSCLAATLLAALSVGWSVDWLVSR